MIEGVSSVAASQAMDGGGGAKSAGATGTSQGWAQQGAADPSANLPSVGSGRELPWARSWSDLSDRMRAMTSNGEQLSSRMMRSQTPEDMPGNMAMLMQAGREMTQTTVQFQMVTAVVTNSASAVNKMLTNQ